MRIPSSTVDHACEVEPLVANPVCDMFLNGFLGSPLVPPAAGPLALSRWGEWCSESSHRSWCAASAEVQSYARCGDASCQCNVDAGSTFLGRRTGPGYGTYINNSCWFEGSDCITIVAGVAIGREVAVLTTTHTIGSADCCASSMV